MKRVPYEGFRSAVDSAPCFIEITAYPSFVFGRGVCPQRKRCGVQGVAGDNFIQRVKIKPKDMDLIVIPIPPTFGFRLRRKLQKRMHRRNHKFFVKDSRELAWGLLFKLGSRTRAAFETSFNVC